jgi:ribosome biogenesis GTPase
MSMDIRRALESDVDALLSLMSQLYSEDGTDPFNRDRHRRAARELISKPESGGIWITVDDDEAVGYVVLTFGFSLEYGGRIAIVDEMYVATSHRRRGLGSKALQFVEDAARRHGVRALHLEVEPENDGARAFYHRSGFRENARQLLIKPLRERDMNLTDLGFGEWFREKQAALEHAEFRPARVTTVDRDRFLVRNESGESAAEITGRLRFSAESSMDFPAVGDWVLVQFHNDETLAIIHELFPRKSVLSRKSSGKKIDHQLIAANIDTAFIMQSCDSNFNIRRLERYLIMVLDGNIEPVILLSKSDLLNEEEIAERISDIESAGIDAQAIPFSSETGDGLEQIRRMLNRGCTYCLLGSSGVGKTTLLNRLTGRETFETNPVREGDGKGRHTTTRRQLVAVDCGALLIDTPGMRELAIIGADAGIDDSFSDIAALSAGCRFNDCDHTDEAGCAVQAAIENGTLSSERLESYLKLVKESEYYQMSYVEKRQKDKQFGKFVRSVMKHKKNKR